MLDEYTPQQSRFADAFCHGGTSRATCEACGRHYFVTYDSEYGYEPGELDELRRLAEAEPDRYIEVSQFSYVSTVVLAGKQVVVGCLCDPTKPWSESIERNAEGLTEYLKLYWEEKRKEAEHDQRVAMEALEALA